MDKTINPLDIAEKKDEIKSLSNKKSLHNESINLLINGLHKTYITKINTELTGANLVAWVSYITNIPHTEFKLYTNM